MSAAEIEIEISIDLVSRWFTSVVSNMSVNMCQSAGRKIRPRLEQERVRERENVSGRRITPGGCDSSLLINPRYLPWIRVFGVLFSWDMALSDPASRGVDQPRMTTALITVEVPRGAAGDLGIAVSSRGVILELIHGGSAADTVLRPGDLIVAVNGVPVNYAKNRHLIANLPPLPVHTFRVKRTTSASPECKLDPSRSVSTSPVKGAPLPRAPAAPALPRHGSEPSGLPHSAGTCGHACQECQLHIQQAVAAAMCVAERRWAAEQKKAVAASVRNFQLNNNELRRQLDEAMLALQTTALCATIELPSPRTLKKAVSFAEGVVRAQPTPTTQHAARHTRMAPCI